MDQNDSEKRIADLEQQLAEPRLRSGSRQFMASPPFYGSSWNPKKGMIYGYLGIVLFAVTMWGLGMLFAEDEAIAEIGGRLVYPVIATLLGWALWAIFAHFRRHTRRKIPISVTGEGLTVSQRPGDVFSFSDAQLGKWAFSASMGTALHLRSGSHRFVLGGRDHRVPGDTRLDAPPTSHVDAWLWATDFDELLAMAPRGGRLDLRRPEPAYPDVRGPAPGAPTRCLLFPNPEFISVQPFWAMGRVLRMAESLQRPQQPLLAIDVGADTVRVVDPNTNELKASAPLAEVIAEPEAYALLRPAFLRWLYSDAWLRARGWTTPVLVVHVPGSEPVSIGCHDLPEHDYIALTNQGVVVRHRFYWRPKVPRRVNRPADYVVSGADWLTLVEKFGLAPYLEDTQNSVHG